MGCLYSQNNENLKSEIDYDNFFIISNNQFEQFSAEQLEDNTNFKSQTGIVTQIGSKFENEEGKSYNLDSLNRNINKKSKIDSLNVMDFSEILIQEFNLVRSDPINYADKIEMMIKYIKPNYERKRSSAFIFRKPGFDKVGLPSGEDGFKNTIDILKKSQKLNELQWCDEIRIPLPEGIEDFNKEILQKIILTKRNELNGNYPNFSVNIDVISDPETSALLQIVDDNTFQGQRRETILDPKFKYIAVAQAKDKKKKVFTLISFA